PWKRQSIALKPNSSIASLVSAGPFFNLLPVSLKRKEVLSQIDYGDTISNVIDMRNRSVISISDKLF
ncbi:MAG: hypothetical protein QME83_08920, partial [Thermodesulfobacteriota bacterium]|nr:hypothetical protein [Thermodesulfobacteriota bacterium]